jgi:dihydrolipoamide dehydrogenase
MSVEEVFDIIVIGAGPAGYTAAIRAAELGFSVLVVDKNPAVGGTCLNVGCIPSKALLDSSERYALARNGLSRHGIVIDHVGLDLRVMMERKNQIVAKLTGGIEFLFSHNHIQLRRGIASLNNSRDVVIDVSGQRSMVSARRAIIIASGSKPRPLAALPFDTTTVVDSTAALSFDHVPDRLAIVGGGAIGVELASVWARLGSQVTVIEQLPQLLPGWDNQTARLLQRLLTNQGISIVTDASINATSMAPDGCHLRIESRDAIMEAVADNVLVAIGRLPDIEGLGLDKVGIKADPHSGRIPVNGQLMTAAPGIYAIGDCVPGPMLAHKAFDEGVAVAENIAGKAGFVNYAAIPGVVYTSPEAASVGATEASLRERGISFTSGSFNFKANGRALAMDLPDGYVKVLADARTDAVLGVHIVGPSASELIAEAVTVMEFGGSSEDIARTMHAHPTLSEAVKEAALELNRRVDASAFRQGTVTTLNRNSIDPNKNIPNIIK